MIRSLHSISNAFLLISILVSIAAARTSGCGKSHNFFGISRRMSITSSGISRNYLIHLPVDYDQNREYPVILGFHGSPGIGLFFEADTKFNFPPWGAGRLFVYPDGVNGSWAGAPYSATSVEEDLRFISDMLAHVKDNFCVDEVRVYATGISNGGGFVNVIACDSTVGGQFAAFAPVAGAFFGYQRGGERSESCNPSRRPLPIIDFHGGNDKTVPYSGSQGGGRDLPNIDEWLEDWAGRSGCSNRTIEDSFGGDVHHVQWSCNGTEGVLQGWKVDSMGHVWPSTEPNFSQLAAGEGPTKIQANDLILAFFQRFTLTATTTTATATSTAAPATSTEPTPSPSSGNASKDATGFNLGLWSSLVLGLALTMVI